MMATAGFGKSWLRGGTVSALVLIAALMLLALGYGLPVWAPLNATTHAIHGPEEARTAALDLRHTALGAAINIVSCFFWAAVATGLWFLLPRHKLWAAALAGLVTAAVAVFVDYGLMPARLRPGWELVLPELGLVLAFLALGIGLAWGLGLSRPARAGAERRPVPAPHPPLRDPLPETQPETPLEALRHPAPGVIDERQGRIDPANVFTADLNALGNNNKQPGGPPDAPAAPVPPPERLRRGR